MVWLLYVSRLSSSQGCFVFAYTGSIHAAEVAAINARREKRTLLADRHLGEAVVAECVKHFVGNTSLETFDRFRYKKKDLREFGGDQREVSKKASVVSK